METQVTAEGIERVIFDGLAELGAAGQVSREATFEDLDVDSLDLVELVMELEDGYGIRIAEDEAERIKTVGQAVDFVLSHASAHPAS